MRIQRFAKLEGLAFRDADSEGPSRVEFSPVLYGVEENGEILIPGAFRNSLQDPENDIYATWNHTPGMPLGRLSNKALTLEDGAEQLRAVVYPNVETSWGCDAIASVKRGDVCGASFGMDVKPSGVKLVNRSGRKVREIHEAYLFEVSLVTDPWYRQTTAVARAKAQEGFNSEALMAAWVACYEGRGTPEQERMIWDMDLLLREVLDRNYQAQQAERTVDAVAASQGTGPAALKLKLEMLKLQEAQARAV